MLGMFFFFGFNGITSILRGLGDSKTPLYFMIISTINNVLLDLLFVVVFKWGIEGVALATVISQAGAFLTAIWYLNKKHPIIKLSFRKYVFDRQIFKSLCSHWASNGLPTIFCCNWNDGNHGNCKHIWNECCSSLTLQLCA